MLILPDNNKSYIFNYCASVKLEQKQIKMNKNSSSLIQKSNILLISKSRIVTLSQQLVSLKQASFSCILTLANYILFKYPDLAPPNSHHPISSTSSLLPCPTPYPQIHLTNNKLFQPWCDYLSLLIKDNKVYQKDNVCRFYDYIDEEFMEKIIIKNNWVEVINIDSQSQGLGLNKGRQILEEIYINKMNKQYNNTHANKHKNKIAVINFATSQLRSDIYQPKIHLFGLLSGIFYNQGDKWTIYNILKSQIPSQQDYKQLDTIILSGSSLSVNTQDKQVERFVETLKKGIEINPKLKILGICFGHQLLAKIFGGKIVSKNLLTGVQMINFNQQLMNQVPYIARSNLQQNTFSLSQYHKDFVTTVPENFNILAQSQTCLIQSLISKDMKYLSFQFHPQYSAQYICGFQLRVENYQTVSNIKSEFHHQIGSIRHQNSLWEIRRVIRNFINWKQEEENNENSQEIQELH